MRPSSTEEEVGGVGEVTEKILAPPSVVGHAREAEKTGPRNSRKRLKGLSFVATEDNPNSLPEGSRCQGPKKGIYTRSVFSGVQEEERPVHGCIVGLSSGDAKRCGTIVESLKQGRKERLDGTEEWKGP